MATLEIDGRRVSYEDHGSGPVALLIHGSPGNARTWARVTEGLASRFRVIAPDLPGYGATTPQPSEQEPTVAYAALLIEALVRHVGAPAVLAGYSFGGVVALALALRAKVPIGALVLFEPVALNILATVDGPSDAATDGTRTRSSRYAAARAIFDDYIQSFERGDERAARKMVDFWFGEGAFARMPEAMTAYLIRETRSNTRDVRATLRERYSPEDLKRLSIPVVTVVGDRSPEITHRIARAITELVPHGSLTTFEKANHALTTTHVDGVAETIARLGSDAASRSALGAARSPSSPGPRP